MSHDRARARIDTAAIAHNASVLAKAAGSARLMAVVKADGYGHGALPAAQAALAGGAQAFGVAAVSELEELREAGITAPIQVLGPLTEAEMARARAAGGELTVWTAIAATQAAALGSEAEPVAVHLKLDTGMGRLGARVEETAELAQAAADPRLRVTGLMTHFATADELEGEHAGFMQEQLLRFGGLVRELGAAFPDAVSHAANSAATLREPRAHLDMVRCGIALYGCSPFMGDPGEHDLRPAMELVSWLASVKRVRSRDSVGYGRTFRARRGTRIGLVPIGYADGYARVLSNSAEVLVGGRRVPVVGTISMDQLTVDLGPEGDEGVGEEVVLIGARGGERILAEDLGRLRGSINYEVTCAVGARVPREAV